MFSMQPGLSTEFTGEEYQASFTSGRYIERAQVFQGLSYAVLENSANFCTEISKPSYEYTNDRKSFSRFQEKKYQSVSREFDQLVRLTFVKVLQTWFQVTQIEQPCFRSRGKATGERSEWCTCCIEINLRDTFRDTGERVTSVTRRPLTRGYVTRRSLVR